MCQPDTCWSCFCDNNIPRQAVIQRGHTSPLKGMQGPPGSLHPTPASTSSVVFDMHPVGEFPTDHGPITSEKWSFKQHRISNSRKYFLPLHHVHALRVALACNGQENATKCKYHDKYTQEGIFPRKPPCTFSTFPEPGKGLGVAAGQAEGATAVAEAGLLLESRGFGCDCQALNGFFGLELICYWACEILDGRFRLCVSACLRVYVV